LGQESPHRTGTSRFFQLAGFTGRVTWADPRLLMDNDVKDAAAC
jgi:hypothetical protein